MSQAPVPLTNDFFNQQWHTYRHVLTHNYMSHRELAEMVCGDLKPRFPDGFSLLDLGCGDAYFSELALRDSGITRYLGVDLSAEALQLSRGAMGTLNCTSRFIEGEIGETVARLDQEVSRFDAILASYSVHHLSQDSKASVFKTARKLLNQNGIFLMVDCVARNEESREEFTERYISWVRADWTTLTTDQVALIEEHIRTYDFPETYSSLISMAEAAGFEASCLYLSPRHTEGLFGFRPV